MQCPLHECGVKWHKMAYIMV